MLAFTGSDNSLGKLTVLDSILNLIFLIDIILNFFTAYFDSRFDLQDDRKVSLD